MKLFRKTMTKDNIRVKFKEPQTAIIPGQAVVFYDDDMIIGGGTIERVSKVKIWRKS